jgi:hypothetical protein
MLFKADSNGIPIKNTVVGGYTIVFSVVCAFAARYTNFLPSAWLIGSAVAASLLLSSFQQYLVGTKNTDEKQKIRLAGLFVIIYLCNFLMLSITLPSLFFRIGFATDTQVHSQILKLNETARLWNCRYSVVLKELSVPLITKICISEQEWASVKEGDAVLVSGKANALGQTVEAISLQR